LRLIDADKLKEHYAWWGDEDSTDDSIKQKELFDVIVDLQPTLSFTPCGMELKTSAQWLPVDGRVYRCSACGDIWGHVHGYKFCPNCGAKMERET